MTMARGVGRTVDALETSCPVERVQASPRPALVRTQEPDEPLVESFLVEGRDLHDRQGGPIPTAAVLDRAKQPASAVHDPARRSCGRDVDKKRIAVMRRPWTG